MGPWLAAIAKAGGEAAQKQAARLALSVGLWALAGIMVLAALGFATAGTYTAIRNALSPVPALFIMAALFLAIAIIVLLIAQRGRKAGRPARRVVVEEEIPEMPLSGNDARLASMGTVAAAFAYGLVSGLMRRRRR